MIESMKNSVWKRKLAACLIVSLCAGICPAPATTKAAETVAQTESSDVEQGTQPFHFAKCMNTFSYFFVFFPVKIRKNTKITKTD